MRRFIFVQEIYIAERITVTQCDTAQLFKTLDGPAMQDPDRISDDSPAFILFFEFHEPVIEPRPYWIIFPSHHPKICQASPYCFDHVRTENDRIM